MIGVGFIFYASLASLHLSCCLLELIKTLWWQDGGGGFICISMPCSSVPVFVFLKVNMSVSCAERPPSPHPYLHHLPLLHLESMALIPLLPCVDYLWCLLFIPHTFMRKCSLMPYFRLPLLSSSVTPHHPLLCIPSAHSPVSRHPFVLLPVDGAPPPHTHTPSCLPSIADGIITLNPRPPRAPSVSLWPWLCSLLDRFLNF